jgi:hypothetical protein
MRHRIFEDAEERIEGRPKPAILSMFASVGQRPDKYMIVFVN